MARCVDGDVVRGQLAVRYPQARIEQVPPDDDPLRLRGGESAWHMTLRSSGPERAPLRRFRDDDLLDPGSDPMMALIGAVAELHPGERVVSAAAAVLAGARLGARQGGCGRGRRRRAGAPGGRGTGAARGRGAGRAGGPGGGRHGRAAGLPLGAGRGGVARRRARGRGARPHLPRRLGVGALERRARAPVRPGGGGREALAHGVRGRGRRDRDHARRGPPRPRARPARKGRRRLPPLRQPRRRALHRLRGAPRPPGGPAAPGGPGAAGSAQRARGARGGGAVAPARRRGRHPAGRALRGEGADARRARRQRRRPGRIDRDGGPAADTLPGGPAAPPPPLRRPHPHGQVDAHGPHSGPQDAREGRRPRLRRHSRRRPARGPGRGPALARARAPRGFGAAGGPCRRAPRAGHQPAGRAGLLRPRQDGGLGGPGREGPVGPVGAQDAVDPRALRKEPARGQLPPCARPPVHDPRRPAAAERLGL